MSTGRVMIRKAKDIVGYPTSVEQMEQAYTHARRVYLQFPVDEEPPEQPLIAAICPHDDYMYAGPLYYPIMSRITASLVIILGVSHRCPLTETIVLDSYDAWQGPYGQVKVHRELRDHILNTMDENYCQQNNKCHELEHSLEAFVPFMQKVKKERTILPVIVTSMSWQTLHHTAERLALNISSFLQENNLLLGDHVQIVISNDSVHYGDQQWGNRNYAPFGTGCRGLDGATNVDKEIIRNYLLGELVPLRVRNLYTSLNNDDKTSRVTWCGRFSIPFGLIFSYYVALRYGKSNLDGYLFNYNTSVELGELPLHETGLGVTAPANLHHWVGYTSLGLVARPL